MLRNSLSKFTILIAICLCVFSQAAIGQPKASGEVDVTKCWAYPVEGGGARLASDGSRVYVGEAGAKIEALSIDGKKLWATEFGGEISSNLLSTDSGLFVVTNTVSGESGKSVSANVLRIVSRETGITNWTAKLPDADSHFLYGYREAVVVVSTNGVIQSLGAKDGAVKWKREIAEGFASEPRFIGDKLVVASTGKQIFTISLESGEIEAMIKVPFGVTANGFAANGGLAAGDDRGNVSLLMNGTDKPFWKFKSGGAISTIIADGGHLVVTSHDNFAYSLAMRNGSVAWKRRLSGRVSHIALFEERLAFVSSVDDHNVALIDLVTGKTAGQLSFGANENINHDPVMSNGLIFILTDEAAYSYSLSGCGAKKEDGPDKGSEPPV